VDLMEMLRKQLVNFPQFIASIPAEKLQYAYGPDKWTIAQVLVRILDCERVFQYRALRFARNDQTPLPGFDQDAYIPYSGAELVSKELLIEQYQAVRQNTITLFASLDQEALMRIGEASGAKMSVRALGFICCGHQKHHRNIIRNRYL
ncbi:MAG: DinB family protein, partial [Eudoraea sp.]|nr:DinB family protein [Eudoraea sp.]